MRTNSFHPSVKRYPIWEVLEYRSEYPFVCDVAPGGTRGTQNRTGVSFNRGYGLIRRRCGQVPSLSKHFWLTTFPYILSIAGTTVMD